MEKKTSLWEKGDPAHVMLVVINRRQIGLHGGSSASSLRPTTRLSRAEDEGNKWNA